MQIIWRLEQNNPDKTSLLDFFFFYHNVSLMCNNTCRCCCNPQSSIRKLFISAAAQAIMKNGALRRSAEIVPFHNFPLQNNYCTVLQKAYRASFKETVTEHNGKLLQDSFFKPCRRCQVQYKGINVNETGTQDFLHSINFAENKKNNCWL